MCKYTERKPNKFLMFFGTYGQDLSASNVLWFWVLFCINDWLFPKFLQAGSWNVYKYILMNHFEGKCIVQDKKSKELISL